VTTRFGWFWLPLGLGALFVTLVVTLTATAGAQAPEETPVQGTFALPTGTGEIITPGDTTPEPSAVASPTEEPTPGPEVQTLVRLEIPTTVEQPVPEGDEFEVQVYVDKVEHMAGFEFALGYDPDKLEPVIISSSEGATAEEGTPVPGGNSVVKTANLAKLFVDDGRDPEGGFLCSQPQVRGSAVSVTCNLLEAPVCAGGAPGISGDGLLGSVFFKAKDGGTTTIEVDKSTLVLDDVAPPCELQEEEPLDIQTIPHRRQGIDVELKADEGSNMLLIVGIVVAVVVIAAAGGGGYLYFRRRQAASG
jgi:hypothetical protein